MTILTPPNIWDHWAMPGHDPRESQVIALDVMANIPADKKYIICQMPVGGGKSPIAVTYANFLGGGGVGTSYILTPQRVLQKQYEDSFVDQRLVSVYGKANYYCHTKMGLDCDIGGDIKPACDNCPAKLAFAKIAVTPHVVLSYKLGLLYSEITPLESAEFPVKDLMVFDECHTLENHLVNHRLVSIAKKRCEDFNLKIISPASLQEAHTWLRMKYAPALVEHFRKLKDAVKIIDDKYEFSHGGLLPSELKTKREHKAVSRHKKMVDSICKTEYDEMEEYYVLVKDDGGFHFKEIYGANLFQTILQPRANRFLFMSSTVLNFDEYAKDLGIPPEEVATISLGSEFPIENRPVYFMPTTKMAYGWDKPENKTSLFGRVLQTSSEWGSEENMMYVVGATKAESLLGIRAMIPNHFLLVPGVGAQGGSLSEVAKLSSPRARVHCEDRSANYRHHVPSARGSGDRSQRA